MDKTQSALLAIIVLGLFLRLYHLDVFSLWTDEVYEVLEARLPLPEMVQDLRGADTPVGLHAIILNLWFKGFWASDYAARLPSAIFGALAVPVAYFVGRRMFDEGTGLVGSLLLSLSAFNVAFSQEARGYSLMTLLALCSMLYMLRMLAERRSPDLLGYIFSSSLLLYAHQYGLFVIIAQNAYFLLIWHRSRNACAIRPGAWIVIQLAVAACYSPGILYSTTMAAERAGTLAWISEPSQDILTLTLAYFCGIAYTRLPYVLVLFWVALVLLPSAGPRRKAGAAFEAGPSLAWIWLLTPMILPLIISLWAPIYQVKYAIAASPAFYLLAARGLSSLRQRRLRALALAFAVGISLAGVAGYYTYPLKEQWREASAYVQSNYEPGDLILFNDCFRVVPFNYYSGKKTVSQWVACLASNSEVPGLVEGSGRCWLIISPYTDAKNETMRIIGRTHELSVERKFQGVSVKLFAAKQPPL
jgi:mannosyltransferase